MLLRYLKSYICNSVAELRLFSCSVRQLKASVNQLEVKLHVFYTLPESISEIQINNNTHEKKIFTIENSYEGCDAHPDDGSRRDN